MCNKRGGGVDNMTHLYTKEKATRKTCTSLAMITEIQEFDPRPDKYHPGHYLFPEFADQLGVVMVSFDGVCLVTGQTRCALYEVGSQCP